MVRTIAITLAGITGAIVLTIGLAAAGFVPVPGSPQPPLTAQALDEPSTEFVTEPVIGNDPARVVIVAPDGSFLTVEVPDGDPASTEALIGLLTQRLGAEAVAPVLAEAEVPSQPQAEPAPQAAAAYEEAYDGDYEEEDDDAYEEEDDHDDYEDDDDD